MQKTHRKSTFSVLDTRKTQTSGEKGDTKIKIKSKMQKIHRKSTFSALDGRKNDTKTKIGSNIRRRIGKIRFQF